MDQKLRETGINLVTEVAKHPKGCEILFDMLKAAFDNDSDAFNDAFIILSRIKKEVFNEQNENGQLKLLRILTE